jgi:hypothetical protein
MGLQVRQVRRDRRRYVTTCAASPSFVPPPLFVFLTVCEFCFLRLPGPGRPDPTFVWEQVKKRKHALDVGNAVMPVHGDNVPMCATDVEVLLSSCSVL